MLRGGGKACRACSEVLEKMHGESWAQYCFPEYGCPKPQLMPENELFVTVYLPMVNCRNGDSLDYRAFIEYMRWNNLSEDEMRDCLEKAVQIESTVIVDILKESIKRLGNQK